MKRLVSSAVALLALAALLFGQLAVGFSQGPIEKEPIPGSDNAWSAPLGDSPGIADQLDSADPPTGDKTIFSEVWPSGSSPEESDPATAAGLEQETLYSIADACVLQGYPTLSLGSTSVPMERPSPMTAISTNVGYIMAERTFRFSSLLLRRWSTTA